MEILHGLDFSQINSVDVSKRRLLIFQRHKLILCQTVDTTQISDQDFYIPSWLASNVDEKEFISMGNGDNSYFTYRLSDDAILPESATAYNLFQLIHNEPLLALAGRALQLLDHYQQHRFCGSCGKTMLRSTAEHLVTCSGCGEGLYPRIAPCIMVAIRREKQILLASRPSTDEMTNYYSVLAGFVEPGETLEQCVHREVYEEVGLKIANLQYFSSQPWPFPQQLMVAYHADYFSGEIDIDPKEIGDAQWFSADNLPLHPPNFTLSGKLIVDFLNS